jgi:hypothetical protein
VVTRARDYLQPSETTNDDGSEKNSRGQSQSLIMPLALNPNQERLKKMQLEGREVHLTSEMLRKAVLLATYVYYFPDWVLQSSKAKAIIGRHPLISGITTSIICLPTYSSVLREANGMVSTRTDMLRDF